MNNPSLRDFASLCRANDVSFSVLMEARRTLGFVAADKPIAGRKVSTMRDALPIGFVQGIDDAEWDYTIGNGMNGPGLYVTFESL